MQGTLLFAKRQLSNLISVMGGSPCDVSEEPVTKEKRKKGWRMSSALLILQPIRRFTYVTAHSPTLPSLYLHHSSFSNPPVASPTSQFILQPFFRFSYVTSSSLNSHGEPPVVSSSCQKAGNTWILDSMYNPSVTLPTSQLILQPFRCFTYITAHSPTLPLRHLRRSSFSIPSFASPTSQALHLIHLASRP